MKVVQLFIESVLRYGLPAHYVGFFIKVRLFPSHGFYVAHCLPQPEPKATKRTLATLQAQFAYLGRRGSQPKDKASGASAEEIGGEYQTLLEQEYFDFVLFEIPWIVL